MNESQSRTERQPGGGAFSEDHDEGVPGFRRLIGMVSRPGAVRAALEDDFHRMRVALFHDGVRVTQIWSESIRAPFTLCPSAGARLEELVGHPLSTDITDMMRLVNARHQCTHLFDLALVAITAAMRPASSRTYRVTVPDEVGGRTTAMLERDGAPILQWRIRGGTIEGPAPYAGVALESGFAAWVSSQLPVEEREAALVLRRTVFVSQGRKEDARSIPVAPATGGCWVQQPGRAEKAFWQGKPRQAEADPGVLSTADLDWLESDSPIPSQAVSQAR